MAVLKAASLSMLRNESSSYVSLDVATECLVSATQKPFVGVMDMTEPCHDNCHDKARQIMKVVVCLSLIHFFKDVFLCFLIHSN